MEEKAIYFMFYLSSYIIFFRQKMPIWIWCQQSLSKPKTPVCNTAQIDILIGDRWYQLTSLERLSRLLCVKHDCIKKAHGYF